MRFAIATIDRHLGIFNAFVQAGWQPVKLFTVPPRHESGNNKAVIQYAADKKVPVQVSRLTENDLKRLKEDGCEVLIVASYDWKIPDWAPYLKYAVNFHPSPLPHGRGPYPVMRAILESWSHWALTCHRLTPGIDQGEILAMETFALSTDEFHESLDLKIQMAGKKLAATIAPNFAEIWDLAKPQTGGSYWPKPELPDHVFEFRQPVDKILRHVRAFGGIGSFVKLDGSWLLVKRAIGWTETHRHVAGTAVHVFNESVIVAVTDGYVGLLDIEMLAPPAVAELEAALAKKTSA